MLDKYHKEYKILTMAIKQNVNEYVGEKGLEAYTQLLTRYYESINDSALSEVEKTLENIEAKLQSIYMASDTGNDSIITNISQLKLSLIQAIESMGYKLNYTDINNVSWDNIKDAILKIPVDSFTKEKNPSNNTYPIPKCYQSWGDNVAYAYDYVMQFQNSLNLTNGIHSTLDVDKTYKGFYAIELSLDAASYSSGSMDYYVKVVGPTGVDGADYASCYMINITNADGSYRMIEFGNDEIGTQKELHFKLTELPQNGKLFLFALYENDKYEATVTRPGSGGGTDANSGKLLLIGGHPKTFNIPSSYRFDEGIIQLNKTGEPFSMALPTVVQEAKDNGQLFILVNDYDYCEKDSVLSFTGSICDVNGNVLYEYADEPFIYDQTTKWWYIIFPSTHSNYAVGGIKEYYVYDKEYDANTQISTKYIVGLTSQKIYYDRFESPILLEDSNNTKVYPWKSVGGELIYTSSPAYLITVGVHMYTVDSVNELIANKGQENYDTKVTEFLNRSDDTVEFVGYISSDDDITNQKRYIWIQNEIRTSPLYIDTDGYNVNMDETSQDTHQGTDYNLPSIITNQIYLRNFKGKTKISSSGYVDKIHMPCCVTHGTTGSGANNKSYLVVSDSNLYELELNSLETVENEETFSINTGINDTTLGIALNNTKLHELVFPNLTLCKGIIAHTCAGLYRIKAPLLKELYAPAAYNCARLTVIDFPNLERVEAQTFINGGMFKELYLPSITNFVLKGGHGYIAGNYFKKITFYKKVTITDSITGSATTSPIFYNLNVEEFEANFKNGIELSGGGNYSVIGSTAANTALKRYTGNGQTYIATRISPSFGAFHNLSSLEEIIIPDTQYITISGNFLYSCPSVKKIVFGSLKEMSSGVSFTSSTKLIHFEVGNDTECDLMLEKWVPSNCYSTIETDLIEENSTSDEVECNLDQLLYNFNACIIEKLKDYTGQETSGKIYLDSTLKSYVLGEDESGRSKEYPHNSEMTFYTRIINGLSNKNWELI